jgi:hypothetical protein
MSDLPQALLAHLQREARDARDRARESREENEKQLTASLQSTRLKSELPERLSR